MHKSAVFISRFFWVALKAFLNPLNVPLFCESITQIGTLRQIRWLNCTRRRSNYSNGRNFKRKSTCFCMKSFYIWKKIYASHLKIFLPFFLRYLDLWPPQSKVQGLTVSHILQLQSSTKSWKKDEKRTLMKKLAIFRKDLVVKEISKSLTPIRGLPPLLAMVVLLLLHWIETLLKWKSESFTLFAYRAFLEYKKRFFLSENKFNSEFLWQ